MGSGQCEAWLCVELACSLAGVGNSKDIQLPGSTANPEATLVPVTAVACRETGFPCLILSGSFSRGHGSSISKPNSE